MNPSLSYLLLCLCVGVAVIVLLTTKYRVPAFFALLIACFVVGLGMQIPPDHVIGIIKDGFGKTMQSLGLIIVLGTALGGLLEYGGSTNVMASFILKKLGERNAPLSMSITGFVVGLAIFCDSGYIVLSGLNRAIARRTGLPMTVMAGSLATGLYAVHCLIPPHPGAAAAAGVMAVDFGKLILWGIVVAIPASFTGWLWVGYMGRKMKPEPVAHEETFPEETIRQPSVIRAFLPILVPILLIGIRSFFTFDGNLPYKWLELLLLSGDPVMALAIGVVLALTGLRAPKKQVVGKLLQDAAERAGGILVIVGAGGAFGAVLASTKIGDLLGSTSLLLNMGILFPFLLTVILKTALGSSTVAVITAASILQPLLPGLGLDSETGRLLCVLAIGSGAMMISHANDAYFWVIAKFSGLDMRSMLKVYSVATVGMGLTAFVMVCLIRFLLHA